MGEIPSKPLTDAVARKDTGTNLQNWFMGFQNSPASQEKNK